MKLLVKERLQRLIINTSFFPFCNLYGMVYNLSVIIATLSLRQVEDVVTIYLRRGAAAGELIYGLSDIDLLVLVRDEDEQKTLRAKERIQSIYVKLSRLLLLFGNADKELGMYSATEFLRLFLDYDFYTYRFYRGKYTWKLLYGEDALKLLPPVEENLLRLQSTEELKVWWDFLTIELGTKISYPKFKRKYLWYKSIAEASKIYLFACHSKNILGRTAALSEIKHYLPLESQKQIDIIAVYPKHLDSKEDLVPDKLMELFITLVHKTHSELEHSVSRTGGEKLVKLQLPNRNNAIINPGVARLLEEFNRNVRDEVKPYLNYITVIPQVEFSMDIFDNFDIDAYCLVLVAKSFIPIEILKKVHSLFGQRVEPQNIEPFIVINDNVAFSLQADRPHHCIKSPRTSPLFFALLAKGAPTGVEYPFEGPPVTVSCLLPSLDFEKTIMKRAERINSFISSKNIYKMKTLDFLRFYWAAARTKLLLRSLNAEEIHIPLTSQQILDMLLTLYPDNSGWLGIFFAEYKKELTGTESGSYRYFSNAVGLLKSIK